MKIHPSLGAWPALPASSAMRGAVEAEEPLFGRLDLAHAQICPQNPGRLTLEDAAALREEFPQTQFRLHANAHAHGWSSLADASTYGQSEFSEYFDRLIELSVAFDAPAYTWHAGLRRHANLKQVFARTMEMEQRMGIPVGIEGLYPTPDGRYLLADWDEYAAMLRSGVKYALDMSHINIVAHRTHRREDGLLRELLASPNCIEIHVSGNNGDADTHGQLATEPWWWSMMVEYANPQATIFTEGGRRRPQFF